MQPLAHFQSALLHKWRKSSLYRLFSPCARRGEKWVPRRGFSRGNHHTGTELRLRNSFCFLCGARHPSNSPANHSLIPHSRRGLLWVHLKEVWWIALWAIMTSPMLSRKRVSPVDGDSEPRLCAPRLCHCYLALNAHITRPGPPGT